MSVTNKKDNLEHLTTLNIEGLKKLVKSKEEISYAKFCPLINLPPLTGASKRSQLKALNEVCEYEKNGIKFKFLRIRDDDEIVIGQKNIKYTKLIEDILVNYLLEQNQDIVFMTPLQLMSFLGMVNKNYVTMKNKNDSFYRHNMIHKQYKNVFSTRQMYTFLNSAYHTILKPIIRNAIKSLDGKRAIRVQGAYNGFVVNDDNSRTYINVLATQRDGKIFTSITSDVLDEYGCKDIQQVFLKGKNCIKNFYKRCNEVCKETTQYDGYYDCYAIILNRKYLGFRQRKDIDALKSELNKRVIEKAYSNQDMQKILPVTIHKNLIYTFFDLNTEYDLQQDYIEFKQDTLNKKSKENNIARI